MISISVTYNPNKELKLEFLLGFQIPESYAAPKVVTLGSRSALCVNDRVRSRARGAGCRASGCVTEGGIA